MAQLDVLSPRWGEISALLDEALALPATERPGWLDALEGVHAGVKNTLRDLLDGYGKIESRDFLATLPRLATSRASAQGVAVDGPAAGTSIGPYRLISELGHGGMGAVWLAERVDGQLARRRVALKLPRLAWGSALADRLARERDILASLEHPHIARLYDAGIEAHGRPYFAMELVEGQAIDAFCRERHLPLRARIALLLQVCDAVAHAHSRLVVHRDLKPGNILVTADGQARLLDFGIAKLMEGDRAEETALTRQAGRALTLDYASPEQIAGAPLGTASDVYSLGVVAYELLAGQRPYRLKRGSAAELEEAIAGVDPPRASDVAAAPTDRRALRGDLDAILAKALRKDPAQRYPTMTAFADDLQRHLQGFAVLAQPERRMYLARKFVLRHRAAVASVAAVVLALGTGLGIALWQYHTASRNLGYAQLAFDRENAVRTMYGETLSTVAGWDVDTFGEPRSVARMLLRKMDELEKRFVGQPAPQLAVLHAVTQQLPYMGDHEGSLAVGQRYLELLKRSSPHPSQLMLAYLQHARTLSTLGRHAEGAATMREALATIPNPHEAPDERVRMQVEFGKMLWKLGERDAATAALREGERLLAHADRPQEARAEIQQMLGRLQFGLDDAEALRETRASHEGFTSLPTARVPQIGFSFWQLGVALARVGRSAEAEAALREGGQRFDQIYGPLDRDSVRLVGDLGVAIAAQGRYDEARVLLGERQALVERRPGPDTALGLRALTARRLQTELLAGDLGAAMRFVADAGAVDPNDAHTLLQALGRAELERARGLDTTRWLEQALEALPAAQRESATAFELRLARADGLRVAGRNDAALAQLQGLLAAMRQARAARNSTFVQAIESSALVLAALGKPRDAIALLESIDAEPAATRVAPPSRAERADSALRRAMVWLAASERGRAEALFESVRADLEGQHPASPRRAAAQQLAAALSR
jgi:serine/threonine-protein kinase